MIDVRKKNFHINRIFMFWDKITRHLLHRNDVLFEITTLSFIGAWFQD
jgi:hypothetical protein